MYLRDTDITETGFKLSWRAPKYANGVILYYLVILKEKQTELHTTETSIIFDDLDDNEIYHTTVQASHLTYFYHLLLSNNLIKH